MINWNKAVKPLLGGPLASPPSGFTTEDLNAVIRAVNVNAEKILDHESKYECFFSSYVALVGHYIANSFDKVQKSLFHEFTAACELLLKFCLQRLQNFDVHCAVPQKNLMQLISALCLGSTPFVRVDVITFTAMLKSAELPMIVQKADSDADVNSQSSQDQPSGSAFIEQMSIAFEVHASGISVTKSGKNVDMSVILKENVASLSRLTRNDNFAQVYKNLSYLKRYVNRFADLKKGKPLVLPDSVSSALTIRNGLGPLASNISIVLQAISLPMTDALTTEKIENLSKLSLSCIYAGLSVATAMTLISEEGKTANISSSATASSSSKGKEPDYESIADTIIYEVFEIYTKTEEILTSRYSSSHVLPNFQMMAAYILSQGLSVILQQHGTIAKEKGHSKTDKQTIPGIFTLALAVTLTEIMEKLMDNFDFEDIVEQWDSFSFSTEVLDINASNNGFSRLAVLTEKCDILSLLINILHLYYENSCGKTTEKVSRKDTTTADDSGASDDENNHDRTFDIMDGSETDYSSFDEDVPNGSFGFTGGPLFGEWFIRVLNEPGSDEIADEPMQFEMSLPDARSTRKFMLPEEALVKNDSLNGFLQKAKISELLSNVISLIDNKFVSSKTVCIKTYVHRHVKVGSVEKLIGFLNRLDASHKNNQLLMRLLHNLLSSDLVNEEIEEAILKALKLDTPVKQLFADSKSLSILFKILFKHQLAERKEGKDHQKTVDFIQNLVEYYQNPETGANGIIKDVDVTIFQMCLFLFHMVSASAQRNFLKSVIHALTRCNEVEKLPIATSRFVLLLEYLLHHYSSPSKQLFAHTQWNLITVHLEPDAADTSNLGFVALGGSDSCKAFSPFLSSIQPSSDSQTKPTSDTETDNTKCNDFFDEMFFEVSDLGISGVDKTAVEVLNSCDISADNLYKIVFSAMNAGGKLKLAFCGDEKYVDERMPELMKRFLVYNFQITWRLHKKIMPLLLEDSNETTSQDLSYFLIAAHSFGFMLNKNFTGIPKENAFDEFAALLQQFVSNHFAYEVDGNIVPKSAFPSFTEIMVLDCLLHEVINTIGRQEENFETPPTLLFPTVMKVMKLLRFVCRSYVMHASREPEESCDLYSSVMETDVAGLKLIEGNLLSSVNFPEMPKSLDSEISKWDSQSRSRIAGDTKNENIDTENVFTSYLKALQNKNPYLTILQYLAETVHQTLAKLSLCDDVGNKSSDVSSYRELLQIVTDTLMSRFTDTKSLGQDPTSEKFKETVWYHVIHQIYDFIINMNAKSEIEERKYSTAFLSFLEQFHSQENSSHMKKAMHHFFISSKEEKDVLTKKDPKSPLTAYSGIQLKYSGDFVALLLCSTPNQKLYNHALFSLICKMFDGIIGKTPDPLLIPIIAEMNKLESLPQMEFDKWLTTFKSFLLDSSKDSSKKADISLKLARFMSHTESPVNHTLALKILEASMVDVESHIESDSITDFLAILMSLAEAKEGQGHDKLFKSALRWLKLCREEMQTYDKMNELTKEQMNVVNVCELILFYIMDVLLVLHEIEAEDQYCSEYEDDLVIHDNENTVEMDKPNVQPVLDYDPTEAEDMSSKLCTYTVTQKEFMNQHWYHCHTCEMTEGIGVCTICAKVCHKGHDLAYAKYGSFFCDCGAKGSKACKALTKRDQVIENSSERILSASSSSTTVVPSASSSMTSLQSKKILSAGASATFVDSTAKTASASGESEEKSRRHKRQKRMKLCKNLDGCRNEILHYLSTDDGKEQCVGLLLDVISDLEKIVEGSEYRSVTPNSTAYARQMMSKLHETDKITLTVETLLVPTLGSQEGAFENVKANFTGEQGQTIRQLINTQMISRVAMSCLSSGSGRRHHLAVSHEKTKLTILQLSALLKQADASKRKLTLTRLSTTQIPFTIVTLANNPCNEEVLAVCGLKDCHILTFTSLGTVNDHLTLHPQLSAGNYIIKALWLPGSTSEIALITAKFVKIYDLSKDVLSPSFYFLIPTGKIRDATFMTPSSGEDSVPWLVIMSSSGYMYHQPLYEFCSATHGPFYITGTLSIVDDSLKEKNDQVGSGGVSVYYSHTLQLLFFSYGNGKNFAATLDVKAEKALKLFTIAFKATNGKASNGSSLALFSWNEVTSHPGLMTCFVYSTGVPVTLLVDPDCIRLQVMKTTTCKARIQDLVAVRHSSWVSDGDRSTLIALCEDGSLRIYLANQETTGFWLHPNLQPKSVFARKKSEGKGVQKNSSADSAKAREQDQIEPIFPVDFFEDCQLIPSNDLEFGGESLLQVYNPNQIKNRLANQDMYIVSKQTFGIEVTIKNKNMVVTGIRMQLGNRGSDFAPTHIYIEDRYISLGPRLKKPRWFDFPLTREESIRNQSKLVIVCGSSVHPDDYNIVDSIKVYGKTKESFGWQEEEAKAVAASVEAREKAKATKGGKSQEKLDHEQSSDGPSNQLKFSQASDSDGYSSPTDKLLLACLASLNCTFAQGSDMGCINEKLKSNALKLASKLIVQDVPHSVHRHVKQLMMNLLPVTDEYHKFKDGTILKHISDTLKNRKVIETPDNNSDDKGQTKWNLRSDEFQILLMELSRISVRRPNNLLSQLENEDASVQNDDTSQVIVTPSPINDHYCTHMQDLMDILLQMINEKPKHRLLNPFCLPGIQHIESSVQAYVDIVHAITMILPSAIGKASQIYYDLLTSKYVQVSSAARSALIRLLYCAPPSQRPKPRSVRSNSKSTDTAPSTRSNSPPSTMSNQAVATASGSGGVLVLTSDQANQIHQPHTSYIRTQEERAELMNDEDEDDDDDDDDDDSDGDMFDDDDVAMEEEMMMEQRGNGIAPSLNREEQLRAMQALEENMNQAQISSSSSQNEENENEAPPVVQPQQNASEVQSQMQRLHDLMQAPENPNYFMQEDNSSLEEMIMDVQDEEFPGFEGDDEAMVEYAIALSLQQSGGEQQSAQQPSGNESVGSQALEQLLQVMNSEAQQNQVGVHHPIQEQVSSSVADTLPSQNVDAVDYAAPEEEIVNVSANQNIVEFHPPGEDKNAAGSIENDIPDIMSEVVNVPSEVDAQPFDFEKIGNMRAKLLDELISRLPEILLLEKGDQSIPYFQVLITLTKLLDPTKEAQMIVLEKVISGLAANINGENHNESLNKISERSALKEILSNIIRCLVILMSGHTRYDTAVNNDSDKLVDLDDMDKQPTTISGITAKILVERNVIGVCISLLNDILQQHWSLTLEKNKVDAVVLTKLLKPIPTSPIPDYSPIISPQYVKAHSSDIFGAYVEMMTERLLHLPYRFKKYYDTEKMSLPENLKHHFAVIPPDDTSFCWILSDYMLSTDIPVIKKRVRKLLSYLCGTKENYREVRDIHALTRYIETITETWEKADGLSKLGTVNFPYDLLISIVTYLEACSAVATKRTTNWQKFCLSINKSCMKFLLELSIYVSENVATSILQLLICAVSVKDKKSDAIKKDVKSTKTTAKTSSKTPLLNASTSDRISTAGNAEMAAKLSQKFLTEIDQKCLHAFLLRFMLEINTTSVRWSAHEFLLQLFRNCDAELRTKLVNSMWLLWPAVPEYGRKAIQFVDLLGYLSIENGLDPEKSELFTDAGFGMLKKQNLLLTSHSNSMLYMQLSNYVDFEGYYLESNPCLICNQPEIPFSSIKLSSIKSDTKYTTTQQIIKLVGSYSLQKVTIKITDIKQTKMIRTVTLLYNNKKVPAIIELKNKPELWHKAKQVVLSQGQNEVKFDLPLPVVATNLMLEFSDFYENVSATTETLQCPRCSASVQANPGICGNCGENVFQCHKCRSINYDEKDPFLCNVCGFSKHAKFDITLLAKPCCAVDTIENEEDRKKTVGVVSVLLEKADLAYYQMLAYKPDLEHLLLHIEKLTTEPLRASAKSVTTSSSTSQVGPVGTRIPVLSAQPVALPPGVSVVTASGLGSGVNIHIRQLAQKYCFEAKNSFDELSKIMKTVLASRKEIVEYDQRQTAAILGNKGLVNNDHNALSSSSSSVSAKNCYGCAASTAKQCIILLRALATDKTSRKRLVNNGLIAELVHISLKRGNSKARKQVQELIGQLVKNDPEASAELSNILLTRIMSAMMHHKQDLFPAAVSSEMNLLVSMLGIQDQCWQVRLRTVVQLFQLSINMQSPAIVESITLPCLKMLQSKAAPAVPAISSKLIKIAKNAQEVTVNAQGWIASEKDQDFSVWKENKLKFGAINTSEDLTKASKSEVRDMHLMEKYATKWRKYVIAKKLEKSDTPHVIPQHRWLRQMLFCKSSRAVRQAACSIVKSLAENQSRKAQVIDMLTSCLDELSSAGEAAAEFFLMYQELIHDPQWKVYLAGRDILPFIGRLIDCEIANLRKLEETTLMLDLQQGYSLKELTELLSELVHVDYIRQHHKSNLVGTVLNGYLSLRKLVIQRTSIIDDTQELLLELLEDMTTGTESETKAFMAVCIETINKYELSDIRTPQFIFERLANIIFPEENNTNEFFLSLDKDPLQEDFLQGRMVGNPYSSNEPGLGPVMRDVKNKICRDCDLVALLEDDNGMELLVNNKIISLDLSVRDVYNKVWLPSHSEEEAMRVVYRMRGLLGEATEDIIDKLDPEVDNRDEEEVYRMSSVLSSCGGIESMLQRLESVQNLTHGRQLVDAIMKLMTYVVRLKSNRKYLMKQELNTLNVLLGTLNLGLQSGEEGVPLVEQLLQVMDRVLQETSDDKTEFVTGDKEKLTLLLQQIDSEVVRHHSKILRGLMRIIPFLSFGDTDLMQMLIDHFKSALEYEKFDENHTAEDAVYLDCFCEISTGIEDNEHGDELKNLIIKNGIVNNTLAYISRYVPQHKKFESEDWKAFVSRPALTYCLRLLAGLSAKHTATQALIGQTSIPDLHRLEQVSTQESIGSLAENVLEAISENPDVAKNIKEVRRETRAEKKRLAMAVREKELGALGMKTNAKGQVVTQTPLLKQIGDLVDESGLTCIICREGYKFEPKKVLGIYTFSRRCTLEEFENKPRKQQGYSTVSHFNVVHYDCHTSAVRAARGREEWESAMLQNANTKCNGLLPLWGPHVLESAFATCLARHNTYLQEATGYKEPNVTSTVHDLKLLFLRFANERSFSEETGGGGPQSNIHLIPYILHMSQYVINTTRSSPREERMVSLFLEAPKESWVESSYSVDGPLYITALCLFVCDKEKWMSNRFLFLKRLLALCQTRQSSASIINKLTDCVVKPFDTYKPFLLFWAMVDLTYTELFKHVPKVEGSDTWSQTLQNYIRNNDSALQETSEKMMSKFQQEFLSIASLEEFVDVAGLHEDVDGDVQVFMKELFESLPK
ncbi:E3 ubiquitin-protein ligase UBR4-like [Styela clava]